LENPVLAKIFKSTAGPVVIYLCEYASSFRLNNLDKMTASFCSVTTFWFQKCALLFKPQTSCHNDQPNGARSYPWLLPFGANPCAVTIHARKQSIVLLTALLLSPDCLLSDQIVLPFFFHPGIYSYC
jgi:hypothetical protein